MTAHNMWPKSLVPYYPFQSPEPHSPLCWQHLHVKHLHISSISWIFMDVLYQCHPFVHPICPWLFTIRSVTKWRPPPQTWPELLDGPGKSPVSKQAVRNRKTVGMWKKSWKTCGKNDEEFLAFSNLFSLSWLQEWRRHWRLFINDAEIESYKQTKR